MKENALPAKDTYLEDAMIKTYQDPKLRADMERALVMWGDVQPVRSAYWRAVLDGDVLTAQKIKLQQRIFQCRAKASTSRAFAGHLDYLVAKEKRLNAQIAAVTK